MNTQLLNQIKQYFKDIQINWITIKSFLSKHKDLKEKLILDFQSQKKLYNNSVIKYCLINLNDKKLGTCISCGTTLTYDQTLKGCKYCSNKCKLSKQNNPFVQKAVKQKIEKTNLKRYGCKNPLQNKEILLKVQKTNLLRYGNICSVQNEQIQNNIKKQNLEKYGVEYNIQRAYVKQKNKAKFLQKYGVDNPFASEEIKHKIKMSNLEKYNSQTPLESKDIQDKIKQKNLEIYGYEYPFQNELIREKIKNTNIQKYGTQNPISCKEIRSKIINSFITKYGVTNPGQLGIIKEISFNKSWERILSWNKYVIPLFNREEYIGHTKIYKWKCSKCGKEFSSRIYSTKHISRDNYNLSIIPRCLCCYPFNQVIGNSRYEKELTNFCKQYFPGLKENIRDIIKPYELDIFIPEIKLAIEFNGIYWHSQEFGIKENYHLIKTQLCQTLRIRLIHIWEDDWINNKEEIKKKLIDIFQNKEIIPNNQMLQRDWYQPIQKEGYQLQIFPPKIIDRNSYHCQNTGYFIYRKQ